MASTTDRGPAAFPAEPGTLAAPILSRRWARLALEAAAWGLLAVLLAGRFWNIHLGEFVDWDESLYAWRAKAAVITGDWLDQSKYSYAGFYSGAFPPLLVWQMGGMFELFGFEEWAARVPSALHGCLALLALWWCGTLLGGKAAGFWSAFFLGSIFYFARYCRMAQFDVPCCAWMITTLALYLASLRRPARRRPLVYMAGAALGLGLMTKIAIPALLFPVIAGAQATWLVFGAPGLESEKPLSLAKRFLADWLVMGGVAAAIWLPWHVFMSAKHGDEFWYWYIGYHLLERRGHVLDWHHGAWGSWWFYLNAAWDRLPTALFSTGLASLFAGAAFLCQGFWARLKGARPGGEGPGAEALARAAAWAPAWIWLVFMATLFQTSTTKREIYLLMVYPALALTAGLFLADFLRRFPSWPGRLLSLAILLTTEMFARSASRTSPAWMLYTGQAQPPEGATVAGEMLFILRPPLLAGIGGAALIVLLAFAWEKLASRKKWRAPRAGSLLIQVVALGLVASSLWRQGVVPLFELDKNAYKVGWQETRPFLDDMERYPRAAYVGHSDQGHPSFMYYLYGQMRESVPLPEDDPRVERFFGYDPDELAPYREPGGLIMSEKWFFDAEWNAEASAKSVEGMEIVFENPWVYIHGRPLER